MSVKKSVAPSWWSYPCPRGDGLLKPSSWIARRTSPAVLCLVDRPFSCWLIIRSSCGDARHHLFAWAGRAGTSDMPDSPAALLLRADHRLRSTSERALERLLHTLSRSRLSWRKPTPTAGANMRAQHRLWKHRRIMVAADSTMAVLVCVWTVGLGGEQLEFGRVDS